MHTGFTVIQWRFLLVLALPGLLAGCQKDQAPTSIVHVYAASSLTEAFTELEQKFEAKHLGTNVALTFAGSQVLRLHIEQGARPDVFASANLSHVKALESSGRITGRYSFARNRLVVVVPTRNPSRIASIEDLQRAKRLVVGNSTVPAGQYTEQVLIKVGDHLGKSVADAIRAKVVSRENNVRLVRAKVAMGEADAAFVYHSDAVVSDRVKILEIPTKMSVSADYAIGRMTGCENPRGRDEWIDYVLSKEGQQVLANYGFEAVQ